MSAVEEIQAAIGKLTTLKAASTRGPWHDWTNDLTEDVELWHDQEQRLWVAGLGLESTHALANAELIVTLHATIDAQLVLLRLEQATAAKYGWPGNPFPEREAVLTLARAINGGTK